ncbi:Heterokaryon incompatibility protein 6, OR allele [Cytospora mali]|uniref:Heterokaryon incompatibility protein 6, OR allele n=1 Tax=Cytospora mali TaxID=578113 RepID=A0A194WCI8_CYTMA|nr:Heterokaryon incompatibility protein 6, OR allele [Valsa mali]
MFNLLIWKSLASSKPPPSNQRIPILGLPEDSTPAPAPDFTRPDRLQDSLSITEPNTEFNHLQGSSGNGVLGPKFFRYRSLRPSEIRLVRLQPARSWRIKCDIFHCRLDEAPAYTAISYAWGDAEDKRSIELDNVSIPITTSLHGALEALRKRGQEDVFVWADALCIDQQNGDEKSQQLRLMTAIYTRAKCVAIWLGPERDNSTLAAELLEKVVATDDPRHLRSMFSSPNGWKKLEAVVSLFERDYWDRLWVVQEVFNAKQIIVYCGSTKLPWSIYRSASALFKSNKRYLESITLEGPEAGNRTVASQKQLSCPQVLAYEGPGSLFDRQKLEYFNKLEKRNPDRMLFRVLLEVMQDFRRKLSGDPRDKVFGIIGVLPERIRREIPVDYKLSVKDVYTNVVDTLIHTTNRLDVICESIHFPRHTNSISLPSWVPDWSYIPEVNSLGAMFNFSADGTQNQAVWEFKGERQNKLQIEAIYLGKIRAHGLSVGTLCKLGDYLMAFLHWRALLLDKFHDADGERRTRLLEEFCLTISLGHGSTNGQDSNKWMKICHDHFATLISYRLPELALDRELAGHIASNLSVSGYYVLRQFLQDNFGSRMMGRCFCITYEDLMGLGSGFMTNDDIIVVPFGCSTPIILRQEGDEFRYVGDVFIRGYMYGKAVDDYKARKRPLRQRKEVDDPGGQQQAEAVKPTRLASQFTAQEQAHSDNDSHDAIELRTALQGRCPAHHGDDLRDSLLLEISPGSRPNSETSISRTSEISSCVSATSPCRHSSSYEIMIKQWNITRTSIRVVTKFLFQAYTALMG